MSTDFRLPNVDDLRPASKLIYRALDVEGELSFSEIEETAGLPSRTVQTALSNLVESGVVSRRESLKDARHRYYSIADGGEQPDGETASVGTGGSE